MDTRPVCEITDAMITTGAEVIVLLLDQFSGQMIGDEEIEAMAVGVFMAMLNARENGNVLFQAPGEDEACAWRGKPASN